LAVSPPGEIAESEWASSTTVTVTLAAAEEGSVEGMHNRSMDVSRVDNSFVLDSGG